MRGKRKQQERSKDDNNNDNITTAREDHDYNKKKKTTERGNDDTKEATITREKMPMAQKRENAARTRKILYENEIKKTIWEKNYGKHSRKK